MGIGDAMNVEGQGNGDDGGTRGLFGGAMKCCVPSSLRDVSEVRQVPDHQEVFASEGGEVSLIIEVLGLEQGLSMSGGGSARHFFDDLAQANSASSTTCDYAADLTDRILPKLPGVPKAALVGRQLVHKFGRGAGDRGAEPDVVRVYLVNVRLLEVETDLLITVNVQYPDEPSAAATVASEACFLHTDSGGAAPPSLSGGQGEGLQSPPPPEPGVEALREALRTFEICDWSLFG